MDTSESAYQYIEDVAHKSVPGKSTALDNPASSVVHTQQMRTIPKDQRKSEAIPAVRMPSADVQRIYNTAKTKGLSVSQFIRDILLSAIPPPIAQQSILDLPVNDETKKNAGRAQVESESTSVTKRIKRCKTHGLPVHQCSTCQNIGY